MGNLSVLDDPEILLKAQQFNLAIRFTYSSKATDNEEYGRSRSASTHCRVFSSTSTGRVTVTLGNFLPFGFDKAGSSGGITTYTAVSGQGATSTLSYDGTKFTQYLNNGMKLTYQAQVGGGNPGKHELTKVEDANGVAQTYTYGSGGEAGLLKTIQVPGGRTVTFSYIASSPTSLLNSVQDWSGRVWTLQYDANRCLTTYQTPLGCITKYAYTSVGGGLATLMNAYETPRGYRTTFTYAGSFVTTKVEQGTTTYVYDLDTTIYNTKTDPSGAITTYNFDLTSGLLASLNLPEGYTVTYT